MRHLHKGVQNLVRLLSLGGASRRLSGVPPAGRAAAATAEKNTTTVDWGP